MKNLLVVTIIVICILSIPACKGTVDKVEYNADKLTMRNWLFKEKGIIAKNNNSPQLDKVFGYIIQSSDIRTNTDGYREKHPSDGMLITGNRGDDYFIFIFTDNPTPDPNFFN